MFGTYYGLWGFLWTKFYLCLHKAHLEIIIGHGGFYSFKPFFVKKIKEINICCIYHVELDEL
jgi:hypothetical protein